MSRSGPRKVSAPRDPSITRGFLCVMSRFDYEFMHGGSARKRP